MCDCFMFKQFWSFLVGKLFNGGSDSGRYYSTKITIINITNTLTTFIKQNISNEENVPKK